MPQTPADPPDPTCSFLFSGSRIPEFQPLGPDPFPSRARDARGRFAKGNSGNPRGRPPGIPNPKRRILDLRALPRSPQALSELLDRKPYLLRPLLAQLLPPLAARDPLESLGINPVTVRTNDDVLLVLRAAWAALARGEITPVEIARVARRVRSRQRALHRLARARNI